MQIVKVGSHELIATIKTFKLAKCKIHKNKLHLKNIVKRMLPKKIWDSLRDLRKKGLLSSRLRANYLYDRQRFIKHGSPDRALSVVTNRVAYIVMLYHSLEKGMSLPNPRDGFGQNKAKDLLNQIEKTLELGCFDSQIGSALKVLQAYVRFNTESGVDLPEIKATTNTLWNRYLAAAKDVTDKIGGGRRLLTKKELGQSEMMDFKSFAFLRHSIRVFTDRVIPNQLITDAVEIAQKSPSVCNRQTSRVHVFDNDVLGQELLRIQNGNTGFGHTANKILLITSDLSAFLSIGERNQCWIDGGLFAMTLIYALHSFGVGSCCLNWSKEMEIDLALRELAKIPESENIIMMLAIGYPPEELSVAWSHRAPVEEVVSYHY